MVFRRQQPRNRKYFHNGAEPPLDNALKPVTVPELERIPLPNEIEPPSTARKSSPSRFPFLNFFKEYQDEIILIGLIFILLDEGIDDDFLIIILVYLLLSGRD